MTKPTYSLVMMTRGRRLQAAFALGQMRDNFLAALAAGYDCRNVVILTSGPRCGLFKREAERGNIELLDCPEQPESGTPRYLGVLRNQMTEAAKGDVIIHWDDDDWYSAQRVRVQLEDLAAADAAMTGFRDYWYYDGCAKQGGPWQPYIYPSGGSLIHTREAWRASPFPEDEIGEDVGFARRLDEKGMKVDQTDSRWHFVHMMRGMGAAKYQEVDAAQTELVRSKMGPEACEFYDSLAEFHHEHGREFRKVQAGQRTYDYIQQRYMRAISKRY